MFLGGTYRGMLFVFFEVWTLEPNSRELGLNRLKARVAVFASPFLAMYRYRTSLQIIVMYNPILRT
jgi:hypothetical protein